MTLNLKCFLFSVLVIAPAAYSKGSSNPPCGDEFSGIISSFVQRRRGEIATNLADDRTLLRYSHAASDGAVTSTFSDKFRTRFHYTLTARPDAQGNIPMVDPEAKAVYVFFHGSGTQKASGRNFVDKMKELSNMGYAAVGIDMPFHGDGPVDKNFYKADYFMNWLHNIVGELRNKGQPIYFAGHSFGPDVIAEYVKRYPHDLDGALLVSPAGFNPELAHWNENYTEKMNFGETIPNDPGGEWAGKVSSEFQWSKPGSPGGDPTVVNPKLKVRVLAGDEEEYVPGPVKKEGKFYKVDGKNTYDLCAAIKKLLSQANCVLESGVGHYIFQHKDSEGNNVIMRELLALDGKKPADVAQLTSTVKAKNESLSPSDLLAQRYALDKVFRTWADQTLGEGAIRSLITNKRSKTAEQILKSFDDPKTGWIEKRYREVDQKIMQTKATNPNFYEAFKKQIDALDRMSPDRTKIYAVYLEFLETGVIPKKDVISQ